MSHVSLERQGGNTPVAPPKGKMPVLMEANGPSQKSIKNTITRDQGSNKSSAYQAIPGNSVRLKSYLSGGRCNENPQGDINGTRSPLNSISIRLRTPEGSFRTIGSQDGGIEIRDVQQFNSANASGILYKWVNYGKGWKSRWFVLQDGVLSYYKLHGPDKIAVNKETEKGLRVIGEDSLKL